MAMYAIRQFGDPVLRQRATEIVDIDDAVRRLANDMLETMYDAPGLGLAATQVGIEKRLFVYDIGDGPGVVINPVISDFRDEWTYEEGCLSIPDVHFDVIRPKEVRLEGIDLNGQPIDIDADELLARCFQHEIDHLDGVLLVARLNTDDRKEAMGILRRRALDLEPVIAGAHTGSDR